MKAVRVEQAHGHTCLAACVIMALRAFDLDVEGDQLALYDKLYDHQQNCPSELLAVALLQSRGLKAKNLINLTLQHLRTACSDGLAICTVSDPQEQRHRTHVVVVTAVQGLTVDVVNPLSDQEAGGLPTGSCAGTVFAAWWRRPGQKQAPNNAILISR